MSESRLDRWRRRLAYWLLPGTTEFDVAMARSHALMGLEEQIRAEDRPGRRSTLKHDYAMLRDKVPVRSEWDEAQRDADEEHRVEVEAGAE